MFRKIPKPTVATLMTAIIAAVCACHSEEVAPPPLTLTALPAQQASSEPPSFVGSFVGTMPVPGSDERPITPMESVAAAAN